MPSTIEIILYAPKAMEDKLRPWRLQVPAMPNVGDLFVYDSQHTWAVEKIEFCCPKERGDHRCELHVRLGNPPSPSRTDATLPAVPSELLPHGKRDLANSTWSHSKNNASGLASKHMPPDALLGL